MNLFEKQSGFVLPIAILIAMVLIIAGGTGYYFYKTSVDETADWEIYQNEEYGFEMKYLEDMRYKKFGSAGVEFAYSDQRFTENTGVYAEMPFLGNASIDIQIHKASIFADGYLSWVIKKKNINKESEIIINGEKFKQVDVVWRLIDGGAPRPEGTREIHTFIDKGGMIYDIVYTQLSNAIDKSEDYNKILSTFKFIELEKVEEDVCEKLTDDYKKKQCYINVAIKTEDISLCKKTYDEDGCYIGVAIGLKDDSLCEKVTEGYRKDMCYSGMTMETKDSRYCEKVTRIESRDTCYFVVALETKNSGPCEKMTDIVQKEGGHVDISKDKCYVDIAVETKDSSLCEKVSDKGLFSRNVCYVKVVVETKDVSLCEKIIDTGDKILGEEWYKNWCYSDLAKETKDAALCGKITDSGNKNACYFEIAIKTKDVSLCEKIIDSERKDGCYFEIALATQGNSLCEKVKNSVFRDRCYTWLSR